MSDADDEEAKRWARFRKWRDAEREAQKVTASVSNWLADMPRQIHEKKALNARFEEAKARITANIRQAGWLETWTVAMNYRRQAEPRLVAWYRHASGMISKGHNVAEFPPPPAPPNIATFKRRADQDQHRFVKRRIQELQAQSSLSEKEAKELKSHQRFITGLARKKQSERRAR